MPHVSMQAPAANLRGSQCTTRSSRRTRCSSAPPGHHRRPTKALGALMGPPPAGPPTRPTPYRPAQCALHISNYMHALKMLAMLSGRRASLLLEMVACTNSAGC